MEVTHFERGNSFISTNNNNILMEFKESPLEKDLITTDRRELKDPAAPPEPEPLPPLILAIEKREEVETAEAREDAVWHETHNAYRIRKVPHWKANNIKRINSGKTIAIVDYTGFRIVIPLKEMIINLWLSPSGQGYMKLMLHQGKYAGKFIRQNL